MLAAGAMFVSKWLAPGTVLGSGFSFFETSFELMLLDANLNRYDAVELLAQLRRGLPDCKLLWLVPSQATDRLIDLTRSRSQGCIREDASFEELRRAIQAILDGKSYFSPELANALFLQLNGRAEGADWAPFVESCHLTVREQEVLRLIAWENLSNKQIARRLHVSLYTVKNHVHNLIEKLDVSDRHSAAQAARTRNLIHASFLGTDSKSACSASPSQMVSTD
jgi:DNA-binding NarL/FixJ family response regulator